MKKIVVVGSINTDLLTVAKSFPKVGETLIGDDFSQLPGGKGANQAVCASKLGADVHFVGCVGNDSNGVESIKNLKQNNINTDHIGVVDGVPSGIAAITIAENDNNIIIVKGANDKVTVDYFKEHIDVLEGAELVMLQLEIPLKTVEYVLEVCRVRGIKTILNPAPAASLSSTIIHNADIITPNELECEQIFGKKYNDAIQDYPNKLIVTRGVHGVVFFNGQEEITIPSHKVKVVDTTGAGDAFNGAFAYGITEGMNMAEAISFGNNVASKTVQKLGAQSAMPKKEELQ